MHQHMPKITLALRMAVQLAEVVSDWHLEEVEIDGEMMSIYDLRDQFHFVLSELTDLQGDSDGRRDN